MHVKQEANAKTIEVEATPETAIKLARGMKAIATAAKLYRKYNVTSGQVPVFKPVEMTISPPRQAERLAQTNVPIGQYACRRCRKPFIGKDRCQCKAVKGK